MRLNWRGKNAIFTRPVFRYAARHVGTGVGQEIGRGGAKMNKQEVIDKLREHGAWCTECHDINGKKDIYVKSAKVRELFEQLDEPQAEKVEVSQEFADWVEKVMKWKHDGSWAVKEIAGYGWGTFMHDPVTGEELVPTKYLWVRTVQNNKEKHIKAIYDGYTVKSKRWVVKFEREGKPCYFSEWLYTYMLRGTGCWDKSHKDVYIFTDHAKAEAVAVLVEGSVEEID